MFVGQTPVYVAFTCKYMIHLPHSLVLLPIPNLFPILTAGPTSNPNSGTTSQSRLPVPISTFLFRNHTFLFWYLYISSHHHSSRPTSSCVIAIISSLY